MAGCTHSHVDAAETLRHDRAFRRVLWIALALNGTMFAVELAASFFGRSMSLQADALDFFGDAWSYGVSLAVLGMGLRVRAGAALVKGVTMALFGLWVIGSTAYHALAGSMPAAELMAPVALLALGANVAVTLLLFRYRGGDSNMRSVWLCSRNDALANIAVLAAAGGVAVTGAGWPDIAVAAVIAGLALSAAASVIRQAWHELGHLATGAAGS
jgi:Co/Zn/Cd efflux system component